MIEGNIGNQIFKQRQIDQSSLHSKLVRLFQHRTLRWQVILGAAVLSGCAAGMFARSISSSRTAGGAIMKGSFVFIFRQGRKLTEEEQKRRTEEVSAWARQRLRDDSSFDPRVLGNESNRLGDSASTNDGAVIALNFIQAADFNEAVELAKTHPGLRYGVSIEVRPWRDPRAQAAPSP
jgi:hypothetical protein